MTVATRALAGTAALSLLVVVAGWGDKTARAQAPGGITLAVPGHANTTPSLAAAGRTVAVVWTGTRDGVSNVYLAMSRDGGATFSTPRRVNDRDGEAGATNEQPPRVVLSGSGPAAVITVMWAKRDTGPMKTRRDVIRLARSTDGGRTFAPARTTHESTLPGARGWQSLTLDSRGRVHAVWLDGRDAEREMAEIARQTGMAHKGQPPQAIYHAVLPPDGPVAETLIAKDVCFCCKTTVAVDARGSVYAAWRHIFPGSLRDIAFAQSSDGGRTFGPLARVSDDKWELNGCPEDGPSMAVDDAGVIHIAWSTLVNDGEPQKAIFYATSRDGRSFSPRARITPKEMTNPGHPQLMLTRNGSAAIVFDEVATGARRVWLSTVMGGRVLNPPRVLSGDEAASYPVVAGPGSDDILVAWVTRPQTGGTSDLSNIKVARVPVLSTLPGRQR